MRLLIVFLKEPIEGTVKTRLASEVGDVDATRFYRALVEILLLQLRGLENCRIRFCFTPDDASDAIRFWLLPMMEATQSDEPDLFHYLTTSGNHQEIDFTPQGNGDLGVRLERAFKQGYDDGFKDIAVIGSDCPQCGARWINAAFSRLTSRDQPASVIGPSEDGGYYLLATNAHQPCLFQNITWSSAQVFEQTLNAARNENIATETLPPLNDVDTHADWLELLESPLGAALKKNLSIPLSP